MNKSSLSVPATQPIRVRLEAIKVHIQSTGKHAFDQDDPVSARRAAEGLEQIDRAEALLAELETLLVKLDEQMVWDAIPDVAISIPSKAKPNTARKGSSKLLNGPALHPPQLYERVIDAMRAIGGTGHLTEIFAEMEKTLAPSLTKADLEPMKNSRYSRWKYNVQWTLTNLKNEGRVEHAGKRGVWRLTSWT